MDKFWKAALAVGGLAAIGAFVFWSLYKKWLSLPIFSQMSADQTFAIMKIFLMLTFTALIALIAAYLLKEKGKHSNLGSEHVFKLHESWEGVNEIDCESLIGPDITKAVRAMTITASAWLNGMVDKKIIIQNHFEDYETIYKVLMACDKVVPGFEKKGTKCSDFVSAEMKKAYLEMTKY